MTLYISLTIHLLDSKAGFYKIYPRGEEAMGRPPLLHKRSSLDTTQDIAKKNQEKSLMLIYTRRGVHQFSLLSLAAGVRIRAHLAVFADGKHGTIALPGHGGLDGGHPAADVDDFADNADGATDGDGA